MTYFHITEMDEEVEEEEVDPEFKTGILSFLKEQHHIFSPSVALSYAHNARCVPELLEAEETAYLTEYHTLSTEIDRLIQIDDKEQFASFLIANRDKIFKFSPTDVFEQICLECAVGCAAAYLESQLHRDVNLSELCSSGMAPLHMAANELSYGLTDLLLRHGADPEVTCVYGTPIMVALKAFSCRHYVRDWTKIESNKPFTELIDLLCSPELEKHLDTIRLLASHTKHLEKLSLRYIEVGGILELAALLIVSGDKLLVSSSEAGLENTPVMQYILGELTQESVKQKFKKKNLVDGFNLIQTLWRAKDILDRYRFPRSVPKHEVPFDIAYDLSRDVGCVLELSNVSCAIIDRLHPKLASEAEVLSRKLCSRKQRPYASTSCSFDELILKKPARGGTSGIQCSSTMPSFYHRPFGTWQPVNLNIPKPVEYQLSKKQMKLSLHNVLALTMVHTPLLWVAKRSIR